MASGRNRDQCVWALISVQYVRLCTKCANKLQPRLHNSTKSPLPRPTHLTQTIISSPISNSLSSQQVSSCILQPQPTYSLKLAHSRSSHLAGKIIRLHPGDRIWKYLSQLTGRRLIRRHDGGFCNAALPRKSSPQWLVAEYDALFRPAPAGRRWTGHKLRRNPSQSKDPTTSFSWMRLDAPQYLAGCLHPYRQPLTKSPLEQCPRPTSKPTFPSMAMGRSLRSSS